MAGLRATERLGQVQPTDADVRDGGWTKYGYALSAFGPYGDWSGDCAKFAWISSARAGRSLARSSAADMFTYHWNRPVERGTGTLPRYGALRRLRRDRDESLRPHRHLGWRRPDRVHPGRRERPASERAAADHRGRLRPYRGWVVPQ
jgi:hypothetical protein